MLFRSPLLLRPELPHDPQQLIPVLLELDRPDAVDGGQAEKDSIEKIIFGNTEIPIPKDRSSQAA